MEEYEEIDESSHQNKERMEDREGEKRSGEEYDDQADPGEDNQIDLVNNRLSNMIVGGFREEKVENDDQEREIDREEEAEENQEIRNEEEELGEGAMAILKIQKRGTKEIRNQSIGVEEGMEKIDRVSKNRPTNKEQKRMEIMENMDDEINESRVAKKTTMKKEGDSINEFESKKFQKKLSSLHQKTVTDEEEAAREIFIRENEDQMEENKRRQSINKPVYDQDELMYIKALNKDKDQDIPDKNLADYFLDIKDDEKSFLPSGNNGKINRDYSQSDLKNKRPTQKLQKELSIEKSSAEKKQTVINYRSNDSQNVSKGGLIGELLQSDSDLIGNKLFESTPETPNMGSPRRKSKDPLRSDGSAYWSKEAPSSENMQLKEKLQEYEDIIRTQAEEIKLLKQQLDSQSQEFPKFLDKGRKFPRSSGFIHKKIEGSFMKNELDVFKSDDMDFWKMAEDTNNSKEPQKLEDIASLKDLWILNMESGAALLSNISGKKAQGVKPNPLNKYEYQGRYSKSRALPKIQTRSNLTRK